MRSEITAAARLQATARHATRAPNDDRTDGRRVTFGGDELQPQPVVAIAALVFEQQWCAAVIRDEHIQVAVVVIVAHGQPAGGKISRETKDEYTKTSIFTLDLDKADAIILRYFEGRKFPQLAQACRRHFEL